MCFQLTQQKKVEAYTMRTRMRRDFRIRSFIRILFVCIYLHTHVRILLKENVQGTRTEGRGIGLTKMRVKKVLNHFSFTCGARNGIKTKSSPGAYVHTYRLYENTKINIQSIMRGFNQDEYTRTNTGTYTCIADVLCVCNGKLCLIFATTPKQKERTRRRR